MQSAARYLERVRQIPAAELREDIRRSFDLSLASVAFDSRDYATSLAVFSAFIDTPNAPDGAPLPGIAIMIAHCLKKLNDTALAIEWYRLAELQTSSEAVADVNRNLAWLFAAQRQHDSAQVRFERSAVMSEQRESSDINGQAWTHFITGRIALGKGDVRKAHAAIDKGLTILEKLRTTLSHSEVGVRRELLSAVASDVRFYAAAQRQWTSVLQRITTITIEDSIRADHSGIVDRAPNVTSLSSIPPFVQYAHQRHAQPLNRSYMTTDAVSETHGWMWIATLKGLYVKCDDVMLPVKGPASSTQGPMRAIALHDSLLRITRYSGHVDTLWIRDVLPSQQDSQGALLPDVVWHQLPDSLPVPHALTAVPGTDSLFVVYRSGFATVRSLQQRPSVHSTHTSTGRWMQSVRTVAAVDSTTMILGGTSGLWKVNRRTGEAQQITSPQHAGLLESIEHVSMLRDGSIAVLASNGVTAVFSDATLRHLRWSSTLERAILNAVVMFDSDRPLRFALERLRIQRTITRQVIPTRSHHRSDVPRIWEPTRSLAVVDSTIACVVYGEHLGIADRTTSSVSLHRIPHSYSPSDTSAWRCYRVDKTTIATISDSSWFIGRITQPTRRQGVTQIGIRTMTSTEFALLSDGGTLHLPSDERSLVLAVARPHSYTSLEIPLTLRASWCDAAIDGRMGEAIPLSGLSPGVNTLVVLSSDIDQPMTLHIIVDPMLTETWWFWTALGMVMVAFGVLLALYLRQRARYRRAELERAAIMERVKIGQDLHDAVGADLVRITMILNRPDDVPREELARIAREANRTLRDIIWTSSAPQTADAVLAQIVERIRTIAVEAGLELDLEIANEIASVPMQASLIRDLVLIVTESITNIVKHARATVIHTCITSSESALHIVLRDNGIGFDVNAAYQGMGLPGMRQRADQSGISLTIRSMPDNGSEVILIVSFEGVS
jgi:signal transduction histidine kinase